MNLTQRTCARQVLTDSHMTQLRGEIPSPSQERKTQADSEEEQGECEATGWERLQATQ